MASTGTATANALVCLPSGAATAATELGRAAPSCSVWPHRSTQTPHRALSPNTHGMTTTTSTDTHIEVATVTATVPKSSSPAKQEGAPWQSSLSMVVRAWRHGTRWWGTALLLFAVAVVMTGIATRVNNPPWAIEESHAALEIVLFWIMLTWIAMLEGCQISIVGLQGHDPETFKDTHPQAYKSCKLVLKGANVERFLVGRQFLLLFNGFLVSRIGGGQSLTNFVMGDWEWNNFATQSFFSNGVMLMIVIVALGQLPTQLVAADKMLCFFNLPLGHHYFGLLPCLAVEFIGLTHSSYLLKDFLCWVCSIDKSAADPAKNVWYYAKCALSVAAVIFSCTFIIKGLALSQTNATEGAGWDQLHGAAAVVVSLFFIFMLACAEGLQVSLLALGLMPASAFQGKSLAWRTCKLAYAGKNMHTFLIGRQFLTAMNMVLLARVTSYAGSGGALLAGGDWGMGQAFNDGLLQTGFLGAIRVVNVAQLASQVTASIFPVAVINNHFMNWVLRLCLLIEAIGIVNACWPLAWLMDRAFSMVPDPTQYQLGSDAKTKGDSSPSSSTPESSSTSAEAAPASANVEAV